MYLSNRMSIRYMMLGNRSMGDWKHWTNMHAVKALCILLFLCLSLSFIPEKVVWLSENKERTTVGLCWKMRNQERKSLISFRQRARRCDCGRESVYMSVWQTKHWVYWITLLMYVCNLIWAETLLLLPHVLLYVLSFVAVNVWVWLIWWKCEKSENVTREKQQFKQQ